MAVAPTGAIYKALEFDGVSSRTYGVYITGEAVYNAPERDVEMIAIPGRNGSFALDKGRFENIEVSYPAGIFADAESDFAEAVSDFRNFLCSRNGYVRLQDEYNPNEYRMAVYKSGLEVTPAQLKAGEFNIVFECKPQRWLKSGESAVTVGEWSDWETESGSIVEIEASETDKVKSLSVALEPIQDLHGYDKPWSGGGGKNKLSPASTSGANINLKGVTATIASDGSITLNGTATDTGFIQVPISNPFPIKEYTATMFNTVAVANNAIQFSLRQQNANNSAGGWFVPNTVGRTFTFTPTAEAYWWQIQISNGAVLSNLKISPMLVEGITAPTSYEPYSNICPISGRTECDTYVSGINVWDEEWENGYYNSSGGSEPSSQHIRGKNYIPVIGGTTYYLRASSSVGMNFCEYDADKNFVAFNQGNANRTATMSSTTAYIRFNMGSAYGTTYNHDISINYPSTDHDYHAYNGQSYTTDLGRTVYGGEVEVVGGALTDKMGYIASYNGETIGEPWISDRDEYVEGTTPSIGAEVVYTLATPQTYQLTPTEVALLKGHNNVWSDGDVTLEYGQDPNVIVNPTLFEASPLLIAEGTGKITVNGTDIRIQNSVVGDCGLCYDLNVPGNYYLAGFTNIYIATGDIIETESINYAFAIYNADSSYTFTSQSITNVTGNPDVLPDATDLPGGEAVVVTCRLDDEAYSFGTALSKTIGFDVNITNSNGDSATIHVEVTAAYDGNKIIEYSAFVGYVPEAFYLYNPMFQFTAAPSITIHSTAATFGNPTYIDCDIGEAYADLGGKISPLNRYIELGSKLPTLAIGNTEITFDNTIATLKVVPRWWKI